MPSAPVTDAALRASLLFAVAERRSAPSAVSALDDEMVSEVSELLRRQGSAEVIEGVLSSIGAGRRSVQTDPSLSISAQKYDRIRRDFLAEHGLDGAKGRSVWPVSSTTILKRAGGSWNQALRQVGLAVSEQRAEGTFGAAKFSPGHFRSALRKFQQHASESGSSTSYQNYLRWRKAHAAAGREDLPSGAAIRNAYGTWKAALEAEAPEPGGR
ncbi:hypothetical protein [Nesterenkonia populi]|uniref:hypothetical protein n=1 Tax=Nesterenkonia populi TaxID=1591087 RepID=UPI0011BD8465|nr:hypothetical protein [Nesterenkonia populi]